MSGNPKGRPEKPQGAAQVLSDILNAPVTITEGGVVRMLSRREIMFKVLASKALSGNIRSIRLVLKAMQDFGLAIEATQPQSIAIQLVKPGDI